MENQLQTEIRVEHGTKKNEYIIHMIFNDELRELYQKDKVVFTWRHTRIITPCLRYTWSESIRNEIDASNDRIIKSINQFIQQP